MEEQLFILFFVAVLCLCAKAQEDCTTFLGSKGRCVTLDECEELRELAKKRNKAGYEILKKYNCGYNDRDPMVCCRDKSADDNETIITSDKCTTNEGDEGICTALTDCTHMQKLLTKKITYEEYLGYIKRAK